MTKHSQDKKLSIVVIGNGDFLQNYKTLRNISLLGSNLSMVSDVFFIYDELLDRELESKASTLNANYETHFKKRENFRSEELLGDILMFINSGNYVSLNCLDNYVLLHHNQNMIFVPQQKIIYGKENYVSESLSSKDPLFRRSYILFENIWGSTYFVRKDDYKILGGENFLFDSTGFLYHALDYGAEVDLIPKTISFILFELERELSTINKQIGKMKVFESKVSQDYPLKHDNSESSINNKIRSKINEITNKNDDRHILKKFASALFPKLYLKLFVIKQKYFQTLDKKYDIWLTDEWEKINEIEPKLYPSLEIPELKISINKNIDFYLEKILSTFPQNIDFLIFCPWLNIGGADKLTLNLIKGLKIKFPNKMIGLITTEKTEINSQASVFGEKVYFFDYGNNFIDLTTTEKVVLLKRFIIQLSPKKIVNINSHMLFNLLLKSSKEISKFSDLYCFCFSPSRSREGKLTGFSVDYIPEIIRDTKFVLTDNFNVVEFLVDTFGLDKDKFRVLYQPIEVSRFTKEDYSAKRTWNILWASRIDYEKLPNILEKIIEKSSDKMFFHIYGKTVMDKKELSTNNRIKKRKNVKFYGEYHGGLRNIDTSNFDLFLYTSWFDGMPNVVLEAMSLGLPVIASDVGGIKEIITDGETGFLIKDIFNEEEYLEKIQEVIIGAYDINKIRKNAFKALENQHSWERYLENLLKIFK